MIFVNQVLWNSYQCSNRLPKLKLIVNNNCQLVSHDNLLALVLHIFLIHVCIYQLYLKRVTQNSKLTNLRPSL